MSLVQEMAAKALSRDPATPLVEYDGRWLSIGEIAATAAEVNALIDASGADPRAPIALVPRNRPGILAAIMGLLLRERHIRMIHPYQSAEGLARDIERLKPAVVIAIAADFAPEVVAACQARGVAGIGMDELAARAVAGCETSTAVCDPPPSEPHIDLLTSGTTGKPKQFPLTYEFIGDEMVTHSPLAVAEGVDPLSLSPAHLYWPFGNFSGLYSTLTPMLHGMRAVLEDRFSIPAVRAYIARFQPAWIGLPPAGVQMILDAEVPREEMACVKAVSVGSAPLPLATHRAFCERYGIPILEAYGATEFGGPVTMMTPDLHAEWGERKIGSVGRPYRGAQLRAIDPDTGEVLPAGTEGLLEVIAPRMGDHWIRTSDRGIVDEDGFVWHRGRADGAIMRGGFKLLPETIEEALVLHEDVAAAMATGVEDRRLGQVPVVGVRLKPGGRKPSVEELEKHLRRHIEATHIPVAWRFLDELPYNAMMKPDRLALRKAFEGAPAA